MSKLLSTSTVPLSDLGRVLVRAGALGSITLLVSDIRVDVFFIQARSSIFYILRSMITSVHFNKRHERPDTHCITQGLINLNRSSLYGQVLLAWLQ